MRIQIYLNKLDPGGCASLRERRWAFLSLKYNVVKLGTVYTKTKHAVITLITIGIMNVLTQFHYMCCTSK